MKHVLFLAKVKAGPDSTKAGAVGERCRSGGPKVNYKRSKLELFAAMIVERVASARGDCTHYGAARRFVVQVVT